MLNTFVAIFSIGIIFLTFDILARDTQNRIREVIDSKPVSNVEIIVGRVTGIILLLLISCVMFLSLLGCYESISLFLGVDYRMGLQPMYVISFVVWNVIPNLLFWGALVACLSVIVRNRLLVALISLSALTGSMWLAHQIPIRLQESVSQYIGSALFPSELAPVFVTPTIVGSRIVILLVSIGLLLFAASLMLRTEPRRAMNTYSGIASLSFGAVIFLGLMYTVQSSANLKTEWANAHRQQSLSAFPDVQKVAGDIELHPGRKISLNVTLTLVPPTANITDSVIFSLNPGYKIQEISVDGVETTAFSFEKGILKLPTELLSDVSHEIRIRATGNPDDRFAYLDQARDFQRLTDSDVRRFGLRSSIFHAEFVALMPDTVWYPISGTALDRDKIEQRSRDLFTTDLTVSVPRNWFVATVGKRQIVEQQRRNTFRFTNQAPVPELALLAAKFDRRSTTINDITFEVLFSKKHRKNLEIFSPATDKISEWVAKRIDTAGSLSLEYPYETFYVVEVPSNLRIYRGGWRMETVLQPPGLMLIRETAFPTAPFERVIGDLDLTDVNSPFKAYALDRIEEYFEDDQQGGNPFGGVARNFVSHQVTATGRGATALQYLLDQLSGQLITQIEGNYVISESEYATFLPNISVGDPPYRRDGSSLSSLRSYRIATLPSTWQLMDQIALFDLDFEVYPILAYRVLLTKGHVVAKSMIAHYGAENIGMLLEQLLINHQEQSFTMEDLVHIASSIGIDLNDWVVAWLEDTVLPGFITSTPTVSKLKDAKLGEAEYQTTFVLHNAEPIPGYARVVWSDGRDRQITLGSEFTVALPEFTYSEPVFVYGQQSKHIAIQSTNPLAEIWVEPYLSYNRIPIEVFVPAVFADDLPESVSLPFESDDDWKPSNNHSITIDDLDSGFSIIALGSNKEDFVRYEHHSTFSIPEEEHEGGLPLRSIHWPGEWQREYHSHSHGHYRRTHAEIFRGEGLSAARFEASLPRAGRWNLEFFVTNAALEKLDSKFPENILGVDIETWTENWNQGRKANSSAPEEHYRLEISDGINEWNPKFDIANAVAGWNEVGTFELGSPEIEVLLSDWAGHKDIKVYADAIRWTSVDSD